MSDNEETGCVIRPILNSPRQNRQIINLRCHSAGQSGRPWFLRSEFGSSGRAGDFQLFHFWHLPTQPIAALSEDLWMRIQPGDALTRPAAEKVVFDLEQKLRANLQIEIHEHVERVD